MLVLIKVQKLSTFLQKKQLLQNLHAYNFMKYINNKQQYLKISSLNF